MTNDDRPLAQRLHWIYANYLRAAERKASTGKARGSARKAMINGLALTFARCLTSPHPEANNGCAGQLGQPCPTKKEKRVRIDIETAKWPGPAARHASLLVAGLLFLNSTACSDSPASPEASTSVASATNSNAPFKTWHQGFNHGTEGWFGEETAGSLGWCGEIAQVDRRDGDVEPSAGAGYATVAQSTCNDFWDGIFSPIFGATLVNGPWGPGPDFALLSNVWPSGGFVMELDIYLDPSWTAGILDPGTVNPFTPPGTVFTYLASLRELGSPDNAFGTFHYFGVPVLPDNGKLSIFGHEVTAAGWYTFRHVFSDDGGGLAVDFELAERRGGTLFAVPITTRFFSGEPTSDLTPTDVGSGYVWFAGIASGLELPIDEHRVRRGR